MSVWKQHGTGSVSVTSATRAEQWRSRRRARVQSIYGKRKWKRFFPLWAFNALITVMNRKENVLQKDSPKCPQGRNLPRDFLRKTSSAKWQWLTCMFTVRFHQVSVNKRDLVFSCYVPRFGFIRTSAALVSVNRLMHFARLFSCIVIFIYTPVKCWSSFWATSSDSRLWSCSNAGVLPPPLTPRETASWCKAHMWDFNPNHILICSIFRVSASCRCWQAASCTELSSDLSATWLDVDVYYFSKSKATWSLFGVWQVYTQQSTSTDQVFVLQ